MDGHTKWVIEHSAFSDFKKQNEEKKNEINKKTHENVNTKKSVFCSLTNRPTDKRIKIYALKSDESTHKKKSDIHLK